MQKVILVGNPNTGKTTLFNTLTHSSEHAGNWHGVTVDVKSKLFTFEKQQFELFDLPGIYSLDDYSTEEKVAVDFIDANPDSVFVCILDANNLARNLFLALQLKEKTDNLVLAVNMAKEVKSFDENALQKAVGIRVVGIDARSGRSVKRLKQAIFEISQNRELNVEENFQNQKIKSIKTIQNFKSKKYEYEENFDITNFEGKCKATFEKVDNILKDAGYKTERPLGASVLDRIFLHKFWGFVCFAMVMAVVFFITFGSLGSFLSDKVGECFGFLSSRVMEWLEKIIHNQFLLDFIQKGVLQGILTILGFMPQIILLFMCLNFLEDVGYLSRVAYLFDPYFKKLGLTGRSVFSLIMGFGCTTTAAITTRNLDSKTLRERTALYLPFFSCSAKLPIYALICSAFFVRYKALIVFALYMTGVLLMMLVALIANKSSKEENKEIFMLEMPKIRVPSARKVIKDAISSAKDFFVRVGGILLASSIVIYLLYNFNFKLQYTGGNGNESIIGTIAKWLSPVFTPLGFGMQGAVIALISGLVAKEMVVSSLAIVNGVETGLLATSLISPASPVHFSTLSALSFLLFVLIYTPCVSACASIKKEVGRKVMIKSILLQCGLAYLVSLAFYNTVNSALNANWGFFTLCVILIALFVICVVKYLKKGKISFQKVPCNACKNACAQKENAYGDDNLSGAGHQGCKTACK
ncbi:MAG: ferrous iron transport protein B [Clostridia bacterium]|nr:ferrous iron transport protein B [Clostridia bacterium]